MATMLCEDCELDVMSESHPEPIDRIEHVCETCDDCGRHGNMVEVIF